MGKKGRKNIKKPKMVNKGPKVRKGEVKESEQATP